MAVRFERIQELGELQKEGYPMKRSAWVLLVITILSALPSMADGDFDWVDDYVGTKYVLRTSVNSNPYVYLMLNTDFALLQTSGDLFPLMAPEEVTITKSDLDIEEGILTFEVVADSWRTGQLVFIAPAKSEDKVGKNDIDALIDLISENPETPPFVGNVDSRMLHYCGSNHSHYLQNTQRVFSVEEAREQGYTPCGACFAPFSLLPNYGLEMALGREVAANIRATYPITASDSLQVYARKIGTRILENWPWELRGYPYKFLVVEGDTPFSTPCPGGWVFLSDDLIRLCESEIELEAMMAHDIAAVEMRHGLRLVQKIQRAAKWSAIATGVVAGVASQKADGPTAAYLGGMAFHISMAASQIAISGYSRDMVMESDAVAVAYLSSVYGKPRRREYANALAKLEYYQECKPLDLQEWSPLSQPANRLRSQFAQNAQVRILNEPKTFKFSAGKSPYLEITVTGITKFSYDYLLPYAKDKTAAEFGLVPLHTYEFHDEIRMFVTVVASNLIKEKAKFRAIEIMFNGRWLKFDNKEDTWIIPNVPTSMVLVHDSDIETGIQDIEPEDMSRPRL